MVRPNEPSRARHYTTSMSAPLAVHLRRSAAPVDILRLNPVGLPSEARRYERRMVGLTRFELVTPRLSSVCSNQLSYRPRYSLQRTGRAGSLKTRQARNTQNPESQIDL